MGVANVFWRPDLVLTVASGLCVWPPPHWLTAALGPMQSHGCTSRIFEIDVAFGLGLLKGEFLQRIVLRMERWILPALRYGIDNFGANDRAAAEEGP